MAKTGWQHFEHVADVGVRGFGPTRADAFAQAAVALTAVVTDPDRVAARDAVEIACEAPDDALLLVDWLNALIYEMTTRRMVFAHFEVEITDHRLRAKAWGEPIDVARHRPATEPKGATLTEAAVVREADGGWRAQCVIDV